MSEPRFSLAKLALFSLGSAVLVLGLTTTLIAVLRPGPGWGLTIALVGIAAAVGALGLVSTRMTHRAFPSDEKPTP